MPALFAALSFNRNGLLTSVYLSLQMDAAPHGPFFRPPLDNNVLRLTPGFDPPSPDMSSSPDPPHAMPNMMGISSKSVVEGQLSHYKLLRPKFAHLRAPGDDSDRS